MRLVERLRAHPWLATACAGALAGAVVGLFLPIRAAAPPKAGEADWALPTRGMIERFDEAQYLSARRARFWGEIRSPGARGAQTAAAWTFGGIVTRPAVRVAVTTPGKPGVSWVGPGETLPDGSVFVAANNDTVWYEKDGCRRARTLYRKPTAESDACIGAKGKPAATAPPGKSAAASRTTSTTPPPARRPQ